MQFDQISFHLEESVTVRLLRSEHAPLALGFFFHAFKKNNRIQIPYLELQTSLERYIEHLDPHLRTQFPHKAEHYLNVWCDEKHRFIRRYYEVHQDEPVTELTYDAERALEWMWNLEKKDFVGAQSRFFMVFESLRDLSEKANTSPEHHVEQLRQKRKLIDSQIDKIRKSGTVERLDETHAREKFLNIIEDARRLLADFRLIEDIFKDITQKVKNEKMRDLVTKGAILGQVLDAYDYLENSDQGKSFDAFWNFLNSTEQQEELRRLSASVLEIPEVKELVSANPQRGYDLALTKLKHQLLQVGQKVLKSRLRLSDELRKLLQNKNLVENQQVMHEVAEIKKLALEHHQIFTEIAPKDFVFFNFLPKVSLPLERPLWQPGKTHEYLNIKMDSSVLEPPSADVLHDFTNPYVVEEAKIKATIADELKIKARVTLAQIVQKHPVVFGALEILTYLNIAASEGRHDINNAHWVDLVFSTKNGHGVISMPEVTFLREF